LTLYLDTSILVSALTNEAETERMQAWLGEQTAGDLAISDWVIIEFSSALALKLRSRQIETAHRADALAAFARICSDSMLILQTSSLQFRMAARFLDQHALGLRAGDAFHLAICADHGATLCTLDHRLAEAGPALGVRTTLL
jgi:predicted nucleic acid-binding protein